MFAGQTSWLTVENMNSKYLRNVDILALEPTLQSDLQQLSLIVVPRSKPPKKLRTQRK